MDFELKAGMNISVTLYDGKDPVEAGATYEYLLSNKESKTPVPLTYTNFKLLIKEVEGLRKPRQDWYTIKMKGELI